MADLDAALVQKILDNTRRKRKPDLQHHCQPDDFWTRLEVAQGGAFCHPTMSSEANLICALKFEDLTRFIWGGHGQAQTFNDLANLCYLLGIAFGKLTGAKPE